MNPCLALRACLSVRFQGLTSPPEYQPSSPSRLRPAKRAALCLPDPCGLGSDSHDGKVFSGKLLKSLTQTGSEGALFCCPRHRSSVLKILSLDLDEVNDREGFGLSRSVIVIRIGGSGVGL